MKSAGEWTYEYHMLPDKAPMHVAPLIRRIQVDALREAAKIASEQGKCCAPILTHMLQERAHSLEITR